MISALSKRSLLLFLSLALTLFSALSISPASALTPAEVSLDALANQKFNGSDSVRAASKKINSKRFPEWTHKDGSFAEW